MTTATTNNHICPFCGETQLRGTIEEISGGIPLLKDGPDQKAEPEYYDLEVTYIQCGNEACLKVLNPDHFFLHGADNYCDCKETEGTHGS